MRLKVSKSKNAASECYNNYYGEHKKNRNSYVYNNCESYNLHILTILSKNKGR
jgi:hypothetical protein